MRAHTFEDLVDAWLDHRRWQSAHTDLAEWHTGCYEAMSRAFGADLCEPPKSPPARPSWLTPLDVSPGFPCDDAHWPSHLHRLMVSSADHAEQITSPFSGYLEAPPSIVCAHECLAPRLAEPLGTARGALQELVRELAGVLYPDAATRRVTCEDLRAQGWDPEAPGPDPLDYW